MTKNDGAFGRGYSDSGQAIPSLNFGGATVYQASLLLPDSIVDGTAELMVDGLGLIACAAKSCSSTPGYAEATVVKCTDAVISPGLINPHDHITYANTGPQGHGDERYEHRHDWRKGIRGHTKLNAPGGAKTDEAGAPRLIPSSAQAALAWCSCTTSAPSA